MHVSKPNKVGEVANIRTYPLPRLYTFGTDHATVQLLVRDTVPKSCPRGGLQTDCALCKIRSTERAIAPDEVSEISEQKGQGLLAHLAVNLDEEGFLTRTGNKHFRAQVELHYSSDHGEFQLRKEDLRTPSVTQNSVRNNSGGQISFTALSALS